MHQPNDGLCGEENGHRSRWQFGAPYPPPPVPGRRAFRLPDGSWIDGLEPGFVTRRTRTRRITTAQARSYTFDSLLQNAPDPSGSEARIQAAQGPLRTRPIVHNQRRDDLARQLGGIIEVDMRPGRADVATAKIVFEVEPRKTLEKGAQEAVAYSARCGLQPALAAFGVITRKELISIYEALRERKYFGLRATTHLQLWWWAGTDWDHISAQSRCVNMPHGSVFGPCRYCRQQIVWLAGDAPGRICHDYDPRIDYDGWADRYEHHCKGLCTARHDQGLACQMGQAIMSLSLHRRASSGRPDRKD